MIMAAQELVENIRFLNQNFTFSSLLFNFFPQVYINAIFLYLLKDVNINLWGFFLLCCMCWNTALLYQLIITYQFRTLIMSMQAMFNFYHSHTGTCLLTINRSCYSSSLFLQKKIFVLMNELIKSK